MNKSQSESLYSAKYAVIVVFGLAILAAVGSWLYVAGLQRRPIRFWGAEQAVLIVRAPHVELLKLAPLAEMDTKPTETLKTDDRSWAIVNLQDISRANGLKNVRNALMNDYSFDWPASVDTAQAEWRYAIRFRDDDRRTTLVFDPERKIAHAYETGASASLAPAIKGVNNFVQDQASMPGP